ncbi:MAG TPA: ubiquitin-like domain-containing protein [Candidatus Rubrimentiphilum sp.]|nr:ubiquitin-like domain-containing protein [Candidatus Rubrimentiphilum sp.]
MTAGYLTHPVSVLAAAADNGSQSVVFESQQTQTVQVTSARTVGDFLKERGITVGSGDYVRPSVDTPISPGMQIEYSASVPLTLADGSDRRAIATNAADVGALLEERGIHLGVYDRVSPSLADPIVAGETIRVTHISKWLSAQTIRIAPKTVHGIDFALAPGKTKVISPGAAGQRLAIIRFTSIDGKLSKRIMASHVLRKPRVRIIAEGVGTYAAFADFAQRGLQKTAYIAANAMDMIATAYTASCAGCSGYTATGYRAGRGIVAVDPRIIPLGTKLFIPGYGFAIAGDTGGAIVGNRIDLGFNSYSDAIQFGRRPIKVYTLR